MDLSHHLETLIRAFFSDIYQQAADLDPEGQSQLESPEEIAEDIREDLSG